MIKKCLISINWYTGWTVMDCPSTVPTHTSYHNWLTDHFRNYLSVYPSKRVLLIPVCVTHCKYDTSHPSPRSPHEFLEEETLRGVPCWRFATQAHLGGKARGNSLRRLSTPCRDWVFGATTTVMWRRAWSL